MTIALDTDVAVKLIRDWMVAHGYEPGDLMTIEELLKEIAEQAGDLASNEALEAMLR